MAVILIVDDEANLRHALGYSLRRMGHEVVEAADGESALEAARQQRIDVVVLDIMLPGIDGFEVCRRIRESSKVPILMLTARDGEIDRVVGLEIGADDYLAKPFSMRELTARIKAMLRRAEFDRSAPEQIVEESIEAGPLLLQVLRRRVFVEGKEVLLKPKEFDLLAFLAQHPGQVFTREQLLDKVWSYTFAGGTRTVDVHIRSLRDKLGDRVEAPRWIETVRGVGYRFGETGKAVQRPAKVRN